MATIHYISPYNKITGVVREDLSANSLRTICEFIQTKYPDIGPLIIDNDLTRKVIIMVNRRNALTLDGLDTSIDDSSEITLLRYMKGG